MPWKMRHVWERENRSLCILCREPTPTSEEEVKQIKKQMERGNANALHPMSGLYFNGTHGLPQDFAKANELCLRAGELGCAKAYFNLGFA